jgi:hypothetical protein
VRTLEAALVAASLVLGAAIPGAAQPAQRPRGDVAGHIAWVAIENHPPTAEFVRQGWEDVFSGGFSAGWYWTEHWKTELDVSGTSTADTYYTRPIIIDGFHNFQAVQSSFERRTLGLGVQYQLFRNAWFHPYAGGGAVFTWERRTDRFEPLWNYRIGPTPQIIREGRIDGPSTEWTSRPFVATGFKAYLTRRAFFRGDLRLAFLGGLEESALRAGFGIDF